MTSKLAEIARSSRRPAAEAPAADEQERCDLCSEPIPPEHRHLLDTRSRELMCACRPCSILFDRGEASEGHYRLIPERRLRLETFRLDDALWDRLRVPVDMAFFFRDSEAGRVVAYYPGPMGVTQSLLELADWRELEDANPVLRSLEPDVEALLVNRARGAHDHWLVPLDDCYALAAVFRTRWRGLGGGSEVWDEVERFFAGLRGRSRPVVDDAKEETWGTSGPARAT